MAGKIEEAQAKAKQIQASAATKAVAGLLDGMLDSIGQAIKGADLRKTDDVVCAGHAVIELIDRLRPALVNLMEVVDVADKERTRELWKQLSEVD